MKSLKETGESVDSKHIKKHRNDVFRMIAALSPEVEHFEVPALLFNHVASFCEQVTNDMPDRNLLKDMGLRRGAPQQLLDILKDLFVVKK